MNYKYIIYWIEYCDQNSILCIMFIIFYDTIFMISTNFSRVLKIYYLYRSNYAYQYFPTECTFYALSIYSKPMRIYTYIRVYNILVKDCSEGREANVQGLVLFKIAGGLVNGPSWSFVLRLETILIRRCYIYTVKKFVRI